MHYVCQDQIHKMRENLTISWLTNYKEAEQLNLEEKIDLWFTSLRSSKCRRKVLVWKLVDLRVFFVMIIKGRFLLNIKCLQIRCIKLLHMLAYQFLCGRDEQWRRKISFRGEDEKRRKMRKIFGEGEYLVHGGEEYQRRKKRNHLEKEN